MNNGSEIKPGIIDMTRFNNAPVIFLDHQYDKPIGNALNLRLDDTGLHFVPNFMSTTDSEKYLNFLHDEGLLMAQPGGIIELDEQGDINKFVLLEVSICYGMKPETLIKA